MNGAALHQRVAGLELHHHLVVELHVDLAGDHDRVVDRIGAVVARDDTRLVAHHAEHGASLDGGAERARGRIVVIVIVDRKALGRPDDAGRHAGPAADDVLGRLVDLDDGAAVRRL